MSCRESSCPHRGSCDFHFVGRRSFARYSEITCLLPPPRALRRGTDAAKAIAVGADVAMMTSAVLRDGPDHIGRVVADLQTWLDDHEYESVDQLRGSMSYSNVADPSAFERANYMQVLHSWTSP